MESELQPGTRVAGRYVIKRLLGKGGMGAVYEAQHEELGRLVALKVLLPKFAQDGDVVTRFFREARAAAAIRHPGIVEVFDLGRDGAMAFIVMEKLDGEELTDRIRYTVNLGQRFVTDVGLEVADAMAAAHAQGVIHRDLKPQNIFLAKQPRGREAVKILDFGIAKLVDSELAAAQPLTRTGEFVGTPLYMAPEQLRGLKDLDARADIYAMGVILYEALCGQPPFHAATLPDLVLKAVTEDPRPLLGLRPGLAPELVAVVMKAMARDRDARFTSAAELRDALTAVAPLLPPDEAPQARAAGERVDSDTMQSGSSDTAPSGPRLGVAASQAGASVAASHGGGSAQGVGAASGGVGAASGGVGAASHGAGAASGASVAASHGAGAASGASVAASHASGAASYGAGAASSSVSAPLGTSAIQPTKSRWPLFAGLAALGVLAAGGVALSSRGTQPEVVVDAGVASAPVAVIDAGVASASAPDAGLSDTDAARAAELAMGPNPSLIGAALDAGTAGAPPKKKVKKVTPQQSNDPELVPR